jgi:hypothetical protein
MGILNANVADPDRSGIEDHAVVIDRLSADRLHQAQEGVVRQIAEPEQVHVPRRTTELTQPRKKQQGALENEAVAMLRTAEAV